MVSLISADILDTTITVSVQDGDAGNEFNNAIPDVTITGFGGFTYVEKLAVEVELASTFTMIEQLAENRPINFKGRFGQFDIGPFTVLTSNDEGGGYTNNINNSSDTISPSDWDVYSQDLAADIYITDGVVWSNYLESDEGNNFGPVKFDSDYDIDFNVKVSVLGRQA